jgi:hypothetical protein
MLTIVFIYNVGAGLLGQNFTEHLAESGSGQTQASQKVKSRFKINGIAFVYLYNSK